MNVTQTVELHFFFGAESNLCVRFTVLESNVTIKKNKNGNKFENPYYSLGLPPKSLVNKKVDL